MFPRSYTLRLDPWAAEYEGALQLSEPEEPEADVDTDIEAPPWAAIRPAPPFLRRVLFVDGVRRIEYRILIEHGDRILHGLLGACGVGTTEVAGAASVTEQTVERVVCVGGGLEVERLVVPVRNSGTSLEFVPLPTPDNSPAAPLLALQSLMRQREAELAERRAAEADLVLLDGPLAYVTSARGPVVGFVKRLVRSYLPPPRAALLRALAVGERTPLFLIKDVRHPRYSWYTRVGAGRTIDSSLTGVVRLETAASQDVRAACRLADLSTASLPRFASTLARDPRAPQNLYPVGALERSLRHRLGDPLVIRRAIEAHLQAELGVG